MTDVCSASDNVCVYVFHFHLNHFIPATLFVHSLCMGGKKISVLGLVFFQWYKGAGFPSLDMQLRVTFPLRVGVPITEQLGGDGGTKTRTGF